MPTEPLLSKPTWVTLVFRAKGDRWNLALPHPASFLPHPGCIWPQGSKTTDLHFQSTSHAWGTVLRGLKNYPLDFPTRLHGMHGIPLMTIIHFTYQYTEDVYPGFSANKWQSSDWNLSSDWNPNGIFSHFAPLPHDTGFLKEMIGVGGKSKHHFLSNQYYSGKLVWMFKYMGRQGNYSQLSERLPRSKN